MRERRYTKIAFNTPSGNPGPSRLEEHFDVYTQSDFLVPSIFDVQVVRQNWAGDASSPITNTGNVYVGSTTNAPHSLGPIGNWEMLLNSEPMEERNKKNMRGLYEVFIVDPEDGAITGPHYRVASSEESAKIKVVTTSQLTKDIDEYDITVRKIGCVRAKREK